MFARSIGWTGGDVAGSINLDADRALWLFGDSWIGKVTDGRHAPGAVLINNSAAILTANFGRTAGSEFDPKRCQFLYGPADDKGRPTAWIVPDQTPDRAHSDSGTDASPTWYWPTGGGALVAGPGSKPRIILFLFHVAKRPGDSGIWGFRTIGSAMAIIDNVQQPPDNWRPKQIQIPFAIAISTARKKNSPRETTWGMAALLQSATPNSPAMLYVYGVRTESPLNRQLLLAKVPETSADKFDAWRFYAGDDKWSADAADATPIANGLTSELSVEPMSGERTSGYLMVHGEPPLGSRIFVRTAPHPEGPWSGPKAVYKAPEPDRDKSYFAYAAKGHLSLSQPGELLISYVVNSHDFNKMFNDASIYRPRFVRVKLDDILPKGKGD